MRLFILPALSSGLELVSASQPWPGWEMGSEKADLFSLSFFSPQTILSYCLFSWCVSQGLYAEILVEVPMGILFNSCSALQEVSNVCKMGRRCLSWRSLWLRRREVTAYPARCDRKVDRRRWEGTWRSPGGGASQNRWHFFQVLRVVLSLSPSITDCSPHYSVDSWIDMQGFLEFHSTPPWLMLSIIARCTCHQGSFLRSITLPYSISSRSWFTARGG